MIELGNIPVIPPFQKSVLQRLWRTQTKCKFRKLKKNTQPLSLHSRLKWEKKVQFCVLFASKVFKFRFNVFVWNSFKQSNGAKGRDVTAICNNVKEARDWSFYFSTLLSGLFQIDVFVSALYFVYVYGHCTVFVFETFFAKFNYLAKARLEPGNTRVSTVGCLNHWATELVQKTGSN